MKRNERCESCGGEDCVCCEVFLEQLADDRYMNEVLEEEPEEASFRPEEDMWDEL